MKYSANKFFFCRFLMFIVYGLQSCMSVIVILVAAKDLQKYGSNNISQLISIVVGVKISVLLLYCIIVHIINIKRKSLYKTTICFYILVVLYITNPIFEQYVAQEHNKILLDEKMKEEIFKNYEKWSPVKALLVQRTQVDAECCGYKDKDMWHNLGYGKSEVGNETVYPNQCCGEAVEKCSGKHVFKNGCRFLSDPKLIKVRAMITSRVNYKYAIAWIILLIIHSFIVFFYHDLLTGHSNITIS